MLRSIIGIILLLTLSVSLYAQDAATSVGQNAIEHRMRFFEGSTTKKFSSKTSSFKIKGQKFSTSSPAIFDGIGYAGTDSGCIFSVTASEIKLLCKLENAGAVEGAPAVTKENVYVGFKNNLFAAFSRDDGKLLWKYETKGPITTTPLVHEKRVYFTTSNGLCYAFDAETGAFKWKFSVLSKASSPAYDKGITFEKDIVYVGNDRQQLYALNAKNGDKLWDHYGAGGQPLMTDLRVHGISKDGSIYALDKNTGHPDWHCRGTLNEGTTELALANNTLVFGNGNNIIAVDSRSGEGFKWEKELSRPLASAPIIIGDLVYAACLDGKLYAFDLQTGNQYSSFDFGFTPQSSPAFIKEGMIYPNGSEILLIRNQ